MSALYDRGLAWKLFSDYLLEKVGSAMQGFMHTVNYSFDANETNFLQGNFPSLTFCLEALYAGLQKRFSHVKLHY